MSKWREENPVIIDYNSRYLESYCDLIDYAQAVGWKPEHLKNLIKEKPMTSEYRRGVEDALKGFECKEVDGMIIPTNTLYGGTQFVVDAFAALAEKRRKKLLTNTITKWVAVAISPSSGKPYAQGYFQDSKESAFSHKTSDPSDTTYIGVYPIEIEVPID